MNIFALSGFINGVLSLSLGIFVFLKNPKPKINRIFILFSLAFALWAIPYGVWLLSQNEAQSIFWLRILMMGVSIIIFTLTWLSLELVGLTEKKKRVLIIFAIITLITIFNSFTPYYIKEIISVANFPFWPRAGPLMVVNMALYFGIMFYGIYYIVKLFPKQKREVKQQLNYLFLCFALAALAGLNNAPQWFGIVFPPYGNFLMLLYPPLLFFAISKYHLFEIKVILTEILVGIMGVILLVLPLLAEPLYLKSLTTSIFLLFCVFGYLLIKGIHREIKRREEIERLNRELDQLNKTLEQKVKERTKELERAKKIAETHREIAEERAKRLERFYSSTIGEKLEIEELKERIRKLEEILKRKR